MQLNDERREKDGNRKFYDFQDPFGLSQFHSESTQSYEKSDCLNVFELIRDNEIGNSQVFSGPFGMRKIVYCDYTASGKPLKFIEDYISSEVLPDYGNIHTTTTVTSLQTTLFRNEARDIIRSSVNASEHDAVIFTGSGCTSAVHKLINGLDLQEPPIVFVSPYEHHSNLLPWREYGSEIVSIAEDEDGKIDVLDLEEKLKLYSSDDKYANSVKIGAFSAASNITGILSDVDALNLLMHKYNGLAFFDYASAAPYVDVNMNPIIDGLQDIKLGYKDAVFISPHKFIGGVQTPGVLIAKKKLFLNSVPNGCGGGTVYFVTENDHRYLKNEEMREEGGTPAIVESIRAGLVFQLKQACGAENIMEKEHEYLLKGFHNLQSINNLHLLGSTSALRLPIFSFLIRHEETGLFLHHNFVTSVLNDLFGIQTRSGCACAGPYGQHLLGIDYELAKIYENTLIKDDVFSEKYKQRVSHEYSQCELLRPGFTRFSLTFFMGEERVSFITKAIAFIAEEGWKLLPLYTFNLETGEWKHRNHQLYKERKWIGNISYKGGKFNYKANNYTQIDTAVFYEDCFIQARQIVDQVMKDCVPLKDQSLIFNEETQKLRWFLLPSEAYSIQRKQKVKTVKMPFEPKVYKNENSSVKLANDWVQVKTSFNRATAKKDIKSANHDVSLEENVQVVVATDQEKLSDQSPKKVKQKTNTKLPNGTSDKKPLAEQSCILKKREVIKDDQFVQNFKWHSPTKQIFKPFTEAVQDFNMIRDNDNVLLCLSGGKDSLSLLHILKQYQYVCKAKGISFTFGAVTVDPMSSSYDPSPLKKYLAALNVPYFYEEQCIMDTAKSLPEGCSSICSFCSRMKRGRFYHTARKNGYNVLALGQHLDDFTESFFMSMFLNGKLWTMKAHYENEEKDLRIIRPLVYVREIDLRSFAESKHLPVITENCPGCFEAPKERQRMKQLLAQQEARYPFLYNNLLSAIKPVLSINKCQINIKALSQVALRLLNENPELYKKMELVSENAKTYDDPIDE